ncbi:secapin-like isoform X2 [Vespula pensylvanica]|uniref:secapin-like isoform X2 n=1 Tax=Vespula pensylvanica TaxID=30213 RepID=UPI001CBA2DDA|nr:secapin-like isoform X2 [Vespula pensylvanica]
MDIKWIFSGNADALYKFQGGTKTRGKMGLSKRHLYLCWYILILAVLTWPLEEGTAKRTKRFEWTDIEQAAKKMTGAISTKLSTIFNRQPADNTSVKMEEESNTTIVLPDVESRQIIVAPIRCPPNHVIINGKCRLNLEGL